jgi:hypothetical protein
MEATFFVEGLSGEIGQKRLFDAANASQVPGTGWPIGAIVTVSEEARPRSTEEGLVAEIVDRQTFSYDFWALRTDGSFYFLRNLEEDADCLLLDDRIERVTELLVYCRRLYSFLGVEKTKSVRISVRFSGLRGRFLATRVPDRPEALTPIGGTCNSDSVQLEATAALQLLEQELVGLVKQLTRSLFWLFDFYEAPDALYRTMVTNRLRVWGFPQSGRV